LLLWLVAPALLLALLLLLLLSAALVAVAFTAAGFGGGRERIAVLLGGFGRRFGGLGGGCGLGLLRGRGLRLRRRVGLHGLAGGLLGGALAHAGLGGSAGIGSVVRQVFFLACCERPQGRAGGGKDGPSRRVRRENPRRITVKASTAPRWRQAVRGENRPDRVAVDARGGVYGDRGIA